MSKNKAKYASTAVALYLIVQVVCNLAKKQLTAFNAFKKKYTEEYIDAILLSVDDAEKMPNNSSRQAQQGSRRTTLAKVNVSVCDLFQKLLRYIEDGFEESRRAEARKEAGADYYEAASGENWKASKTMQEMAMLFMSEHLAELAAGDMPDDFAAVFGEKNAAFLTALADFVTGKNASGGEAGDKLAANNDLYGRIRNLMKDGRVIFRGNDVMLKQFSYAAQKKLLGGNGKTGFRFWLREAGTLVAVKAASIRFLPSGLVFDEVVDGVVLVHLPELKKDEKYSYVLTAPGYEERTGMLVADTGVMHRVDLILDKAVMSVEGDEEKAKVG